MVKVLGAHRKGKTSSPSRARRKLERGASVCVAPGEPEEGREPAPWGRQDAGSPRPRLQQSPLLFPPSARKEHACGAPDMDLRDEGRGHIPKCHVQLRMIPIWQFGSGQQALSEGSQSIPTLHVVAAATKVPAPSCLDQQVCKRSLSLDLAKAKNILPDHYFNMLLTR